MFEGPRIEELLEALGAQLEELDAPYTELVVVGGAALNCIGLIIRPTKDIDCVAFAEIDDTGKIVLKQIDKFPARLEKAIRIIAEASNLAGDWVNPGPTALVADGLPDGIENRLEAKQYGKRLRIHFISRYDQIHLKLFATEQGPGRHVDDLLALKPTIEEIQQAFKWCLTQDPSPGFKALLQEILTTLGFGDAIAGL